LEDTLDKPAEGAGALYLENADTPFSVSDANHRRQGQDRSTGVYLNEDGRARTRQQVDLVA
jgi:hypothetical protein